jgi:hypothetical protein
MMLLSKIDFSVASSGEIITFYHQQQQQQEHQQKQRKHDNPI